MKSICSSRWLIALVASTALPLIVKGQPIEASGTAVEAILDASRYNKVVSLKGNFVEYAPEIKPDAINIEDSFETIFDLQDTSKISIKLDPIRRRWVNGLAPFLETNEAIAYNGKYWISEVISQKQANGVLSPVKTAIISNNPPPYISSMHNETGENFMLSRTFVKNGAVVKSLKELLFDKVTKPVFSVDTDSGSEMLIISIGDECTKTKITCDPKKDYALVKKETQIGACDPEILYDTISVKELKQIEEHCWIPTDVEHTMTRGGKLLCRQEFHVTDAKVLDSSSVGPKTFDLAIPSGWLVEDDRYGVKFISGDDTSTVLKAIKQAP